MKKELAVALILAIAAAIGVHLLMSMPKDRLTIELHYDHNGEHTKTTATDSAAEKQ